MLTRLPWGKVEDGLFSWNAPKREQMSRADDFFCRFLLKYITGSRDEVALLDKGIGGLVELQEMVNRYEEKSPLYGFIQYRRRKVILKYIPEGTTRLLQGEFFLFTRHDSS